MGNFLPFSGSLCILPLRLMAKYDRGNLTRIDRTIQKFCASRTGLVVSYDNAWVASAVLALPVQRAQFTFSTQGILTHSKAQGGEAGAQPTFSRARVLAARDPGLSLARFCAAQSLTRETNMHSKSATSPRDIKI